jgi:hypothetical protein
VKRDTGLEISLNKQRTTSIQVPLIRGNFPEKIWLRANLEERISPLETLILDEVYFLSAQDLAKLSEYLWMGKGITNTICGGLNWATYLVSYHHREEILYLPTS